MKLNINDFEKAEEMDPLEELNKRFVSESMSMPAPKEMGDARAAEEAGQFGDPGSSRTVKATPKDMPKAAPKAAPKATPKSEALDTGSDMARMMNRVKSVEKPVDKTKLSANERTKQNIEENLASARSGSGPTDSRDVNARLRDSGIGESISNYFKNFKTPSQRKAQEQKASKGYASGGSVSSASKRGDGIAQRGKTRGKMC